jgi:signal recognition particle subunit SRP68
LRSTKTTQSLTLAHQYIVYLLLSHRIRRDLLLADTIFSSTPSLSGDPASFKIPGGRVKVEEAVKSLAAIIKLYDTVLQSMNQLRSLAIVEEKEGVQASAEGLEAYFHATR